jgi:hypothetical protein
VMFYCRGERAALLLNSHALSDCCAFWEHWGCRLGTWAEGEVGVVCIDPKWTAAYRWEPTSLQFALPPPPTSSSCALVCNLLLCVHCYDTSYCTFQYRLRVSQLGSWPHLLK